MPNDGQNSANHWRADARTKSSHDAIQDVAKHLKVGGQWRFRRKDIEKWVEAQMDRRARRKAR